MTTLLNESARRICRIRHRGRVAVDRAVAAYRRAQDASGDADLFSPFRAVCDALDALRDALDEAFLDAADEAERALEARRKGDAEPKSPAEWLRPQPVPDYSPADSWVGPRFSLDEGQERLDLMSDILVMLFGDRAPGVAKRMVGARGGKIGAALSMPGEERYATESPGEGWVRQPPGPRGGIKWVYQGGAAPATQPTAQPAPNAPEPPPVTPTAPEVVADPVPETEVVEPPPVPRLSSDQARAKRGREAHAAFMAKVQSGQPLKLEDKLALVPHLSILQIGALRDIWTTLGGKEALHAPSANPSQARAAVRTILAAAAAEPTFKPRIIVARPEHTQPANPDLVPENLRKFLVSPDGSDHQLQGAAKTIDAVDRVGGMLLADGAGAGKTRQMLAVAQTYANRGKKAVLVAPAGIIKPDWAENTFSGSVGKDGAAMGITLKLNKGNADIQPGEVHVTTYEQLASMKDKIDADTLVIFDEAHGLKNAESARAKHGRDVAERAMGVVYGTATPADSATDLAYLFRTKLFGDEPWERVRKKFDPDRVGAAEALKNTSEMFDKLTADGVMIKREISLDGVTAQFDHIDLGESARQALQSIGEGAPARERAQVLMRQRFAQEKLKIPHAVGAVNEELAAGRRVVIFVAGVGGDEDGGVGTAGQLRQALAASGIDDASIAELHGGEGGGGRETVEAFQAGTARVLITTAQSGGTGHNLDDVVGDAPRTQIILTAPFSAIDNSQIWGRTHRLTTRSESKMRYVFADTDIERWNAELIRSKVKSLGAIVEGEAHRQDIPDVLASPTKPLEAPVPAPPPPAPEVRPPAEIVVHGRPAEDQTPAVTLSTDVHGREHRGKGEGGGQFTGKGEGGGDEPTTKKVKHPPVTDIDMSWSDQQTFRNTLKHSPEDVKDGVNVVEPFVFVVKDGKAEIQKHLNAEYDNEVNGYRIEEREIPPEDLRDRVYVHSSSVGGKDITELKPGKEQGQWGANEFNAIYLAQQGLGRDNEWGKHAYSAKLPKDLKIASRADVNAARLKHRELTPQEALEKEGYDAVAYLDARGDVWEIALFSNKLIPADNKPAITLSTDVDSHGHHHKGKGPGGGQFTGIGSSGGDDDSLRSGAHPQGHKYSNPQHQSVSEGVFDLADMLDMPTEKVDDVRARIIEADKHYPAITPIGTALDYVATTIQDLVTDLEAQLTNGNPWGPSIIRALRTHIGNIFLSLRRADPSGYYTHEIKDFLQDAEDIIKEQK